MKTAWGIGILALFAAGLGGTTPATAQGELDRLESGIRTSNGTAAPTVAAAQRVYLGARVDNDMGGVRVLSVTNGGPADRAGLHAQDLIVGAAGRRIRLLSELSTILNGLHPGDRLTLEFVRENQPLRTEVVVAAPPGAAQPGQPGAPPPAGWGARPTDSIPPPPGDVPPPDGSKPAPLPDGPLFGTPIPQPVPANSPQSQIEDLRRRIDQLERRIQELERALAQPPRKQTIPPPP